MSRKSKYLNATLAVLFSFIASYAISSLADEAPLLDKDPHYTAVGFFDMHLCNWPERPPFFKILFSTEKFESVTEMEVFDPSGKSLAVLKKDQFMRLKRKNKPEKRVFLVDLDVPENVATGWYTVKVRTADGILHSAKDYITLTRINRVTGLKPVSETESVTLPVTLQWEKVTGAAFYKVFLRDEWTGKIIYQSKLTSDKEIEVPASKLTPGGYYSWAVHARDLNEHILLGDFHMGSMSEKSFFTVAE